MGSLQKFQSICSSRLANYSYGWDCKDNLKLFKFYDSKFKSSALNIVAKCFFIDFTQIEAS